MNKALRYAIFLFCGLLAPSSHAWDVSVVSQQTKPLSLEPGDPAWSQVAPVAVRLAPQKLLAPGGGGSVISVEVQSLRTQTDIYFRLRWADPKKDSKFELSDQFVDAAAVQFPLNAGQLPPPFMGAQGQPVNIWRWSAAMQEPDRFPQAYADYHRPDAIEKTVRYPDRPEDLVAEGFGTLGRRPSQAVEGNGAWSEGYWTVVLKRSLAVQGGAAFKNNTIVPVAFAVWDGSAGDRDGAKSFSVWQNLLLDRKVPTLAKNNIQRGRQVYARYGCAVCHGPAGKGGIPNPNAQIDPIPPLNRVAEGFTEEEVKTVVREGRIPGAKDPDGIQPQLWMNSWKNLMDEEELDALVDYLFSLMPKEKEEW